MTVPTHQIRDAGPVPPAAGRRWLSVGASTASDSRQAGEAAARAAVTGPSPTVLVAFVSPILDAAEVSAGIRAVAAGVPLVGCSTHGEISPAGAQDRGVVVVALGGEGLAVETAVARDVGGRQREAGAELAASVRPVAGRPHQVLILLTDGFIRDQEEILRGVYGVLGARVPLFGGAAADAWRMTGALQLHGEEVLTGAVVAVALSSEAPLGIGIRHGWQTHGEPMVVTHAGDGRVHELDDRPALDVFLDRLGAPADARHDVAAFTRFALEHPVGVQRRSGVEMRNLSTEPDLEQRSLGGGGSIAEGGLIWAMVGERDALEGAARLACREAVDRLGGHRPIGLFTFSCAALRAVIGDEGIGRETAEIAQELAGLPFGGFYTYGEIARARGIDGFHNQTAVALALA